MNRRGFIAALGTLAGALVGARVAKALPSPRPYEALPVLGILDIQEGPPTASHPYALHVADHVPATYATRITARTFRMMSRNLSAGSASES